MFPRPVSTLIIAFALGLLAVVFIAPGALAAEEATPPKTAYTGFDGTPCESEFKLHCSHAVSENTGYNCLRMFYKRKALSAECGALTEEMREKRQAKALAIQKKWKQACEGDIGKFCAEHASARAFTIKGCLGRHRDELSKECNENLPFRPGYKGKGSIRWRDGSEPKDWALKNAMEDRPRKTQERVAEKGEEGWIAEHEEMRKPKNAEGDAANQVSIEPAGEKAAGEAGASGEATESADTE